MIDLYQITKFFDEHSPFVLAMATFALVGITGYYAIQTRFLTKNQLRPSLSPFLIGQLFCPMSQYLKGLSQNNVGPFDMGLNLKNVGIDVAFNVQVEYSIKGIKGSKETKMIHIIEHDMEKSFALVQGGQPLRSDRLA